MLRRFIVFAALVWAGAGAALAAGDGKMELERARRLLEAGKYRAAIQRLEQLLGDLDLTEPRDVARAHMYLGVAYFTVDEKGEAEKHFRNLLDFDPEAQLDPLYSSPKVRSFFEQLQAEKQREEQRRRAALEEQRRQAAQERARAAPPAPAAAPAKLAPADLAYTPPLERERFPLGYNFIPFGVGQFKNGRKGKGIFFLSLESATLVTSLVMLSMYETQKDGSGGFSDPDLAGAYRSAFLGTFFTFVGASVLGIADSLFDYYQPAPAAQRGDIGLALFGPGLGVRGAF
jgi:tetratricopeptide (TPR) repeat protein